MRYSLFLVIATLINFSTISALDDWNTRRLTEIRWLMDRQDEAESRAKADNKGVINPVKLKEKVWEKLTSDHLPFSWEQDGISGFTLNISCPSCHCGFMRNPYLNAQRVPIEELDGDRARMDPFFTLNQSRMGAVARIVGLGAASVQDVFCLQEFPLTYALDKTACRNPYTSLLLRQCSDFSMFSNGVGEHSWKNVYTDGKELTVQYGCVTLLRRSKYEAKKVDLLSIPVQFTDVGSQKKTESFNFRAGLLLHVTKTGDVPSEFFLYNIHTPYIPDSSTGPESPFSHLDAPRVLAQSLEQIYKAYCRGLPLLVTGDANLDGRLMAPYFEDVKADIFVMEGGSIAARAEMPHQMSIGTTDLFVSITPK